MRWSRSIRWINALLMSSALISCRNVKPVSYLGDADLQYYRDRTTQIEYSNVDQPTNEGVVITQRPHTVRDREKDEIWELTLLQAVHIGVQNNKIIRTRANNQVLLQTPLTVPSVYDTAIRETGFLFGSRGVEAALADFDATLTSTLAFGKNEVVINSASPFTGGPLFINNTNTAQSLTSLSKTFANGGQIQLNNNVNYLGTNVPNTSVPLTSSYNGLAQIQYVQPLWATAGVEYNRIAAPPRGGLGGVTGVSQGVVISRINTDLALADFENAVITMVKDIEDLYWELYLAYRQFDASSVNRDSMLRTWREVKAKMDVGSTDGKASIEAQARDAYMDARATFETNWSAVLAAENALRKEIGLPVNDGKLIRPADTPLDSEFVASWESTLIDALTRRWELRKQKWQIKSFELQRIAALSVTHPTLNFVGGYQVNGFGNNLLGQNTANYNSFYGNMSTFDQTGWQAGLQFSMPLGFRAAQAQLRNTELQLIKARAALSAQELDISHELAETMQNMYVAYMTAQTYMDRKIAAERRVEATEAEFEAGISGATLDFVLRAQASSAAAEIAYYTSLVNYNKAITELHQRRGTLLDNDGICLAEGEWNTCAQQDAVRRAWARSFAWPNRHLRTDPEEFASPAAYPKTDIYNFMPDDSGVVPPGAPEIETPTPIEK